MDLTILECCLGCGSKVLANKCCDETMKLKETNLECQKCHKNVEVNMCCGKHMHEKKG